MRLVILGAGGYGRTVADVAEQLGYEDIIVLDDALEGKELSTFTQYIADDTEFIPAFGNNEFRMKWIDSILEAGGKFATLIHPSAYASPKALIGMGTVILPGSVINTNTKIGNGCIINIGALIDHSNIIGEGCHICCGAIVKAENVISPKTKIEAGTVIEARTLK